MKSVFLILATLLAFAQPSRAQSPTKPQAPARPLMRPPFPAQKRLNVAVLIYPGVGLGDFNAPTDVFIKANRLTRGQYNVYTVAMQPGPVRAQGGVVLVPSYVAGRLPRPDILVVPGGTVGVVDSLARQQAPLIGFIRHYRDSVQVLLSVCTGAYLLGAAGALDGHRATTHYFVANDLQAEYPRMTLVRDVRYVQDGRLLTTSGVTTGTDGAMHLVEQFSGPRIVDFVTRGLQYVPREADPWPLPVEGMKFDRAQQRKNRMLMQ